MKYILEIEVPTQATDSNRILGVNKYAKHAIFKKIKNEILLLTSNKKPQRPLTGFTLSITRYGKKTLDFDNLISSFKPAIDGLKMAGIIKDDSWKYIRNIQANQVVSKTEKKLVIRVEQTTQGQVNDAMELMQEKIAKQLYSGTSSMGGTVIGTGLLGQL